MIVYRKRVSKKTCTAYHEAGHAVAAYLVRRKFRYVTIRPFGEYVGHMRHHQQGDGFLVGGEERGWTRSSLERDVMVSLAGNVAVHLLTGTHDRIGAWADHHMAMDLAEHICSSRRQGEAFVRWLSIRIEDMLGSPANWHAVESLAEELMVRGKLGHAKALEVIRSAKRQFRRRRWKDMPRRLPMFPVAGG